MLLTLWDNKLAVKGWGCQPRSCKTFFSPFPRQDKFKKINGEDKRKSNRSFRPGYLAMHNIPRSITQKPKQARFEYNIPRSRLGSEVTVRWRNDLGGDDL